MVKKRVIPCLDVTGGRVVKGVRFESLRDVGDPVELAQRYSELGADELVFLDITASVEGHGPILELVERAAEMLTIPFTVGGGVAGLEDARSLLRAGADKVAINTAAVRRPEVITEVARRFGSQCMVLSVEAKRRPSGIGWEAYTNNGREHTDLDVVDWVKRAIGLGAGEILLTSVDREGTRRGFDLELTAAVARSPDRTGFYIRAGFLF